MRRASKILFGLAMSLVAGLAIVALLAWLVLSSEWFQNRLRQRIELEAERVTGGEVELGGFAFDWRRLEVTLTGLVLRGKEPPSHRPLFQARQISVGLKVVSFLRRDIDVESIALEKPELSVEVAEDGSTNFPTPKIRPAGDITEVLLRLAARRFAARQGALYWNSRKIPLDITARDLKVDAAFLPAERAYAGSFLAREIIFQAPRLRELAFGAGVQWKLQAGEIQIAKGEFALPHDSRASVSGSIRVAPSPVAQFQLAGWFTGRAAQQWFQLPFRLDERSQFSLAGTAQLGGGQAYQFSGTLQATRVGLDIPPVKLRNVDFKSEVALAPGQLYWKNLEARLLGGRAWAEGNWLDWREVRVQLKFSGVALDQLGLSTGLGKLPWSGRASGSATLRGQLGRDLAGQLTATIAPAGPRIPLSGQVQVQFTRAGRALYFRPSSLTWGTTRLNLSGSTGEGLKCSLYLENLDDLRPAAELLGRRWPEQLPVKLHRGSAQFGGVVFDPFGSPRVAGHVSAGPLWIKNTVVEELAADLDLDPTRLRLRQVKAQLAGGSASGTLELALEGFRWANSSQWQGAFQLRKLDVQQIARWLGRKESVAGALSGELTLAGTVGQPLLAGTLRIAGPQFQQERFDQLSLRVDFRPGLVRLGEAWLVGPPGKLSLQGAYRYSPDDPRAGEAEFEVASSGWELGRMRAIRQQAPRLAALLELSLGGRLQVYQGQASLSLLSGEVKVRQARLGEQKLGAASFKASTRNRILEVDGSAQLRKAEIQVHAEWNLRGRSVGLGQVRFRNLDLESLQTLGLFGGEEGKLPARAVLDGEVGFAGPILNPRQWNGVVRLTRLEVVPLLQPEGRPLAELALRNQGPLLFGIDLARITVESARLVSPRADLQLSGVLALDRKRPWNLRITGQVDLEALQAWRPDLMAKGDSRLDVAIRGPLMSPEITGRLEFAGASVYLRDLPTGLTDIRGTVLFDRDRAQLEQFTCRVGGGTIQLSGFVGFGTPQWVYRLHAEGKGIRVRYPEGVSTNLDASLDLTGTSTRSLLSGELTVQRAAFDPRTDIASVLARLGRSAPPLQITNPFLLGMQFDVRVRTGAEAEFLTSLTRDIELEADLRVRGGPVRPVVLGRVIINRGEILFYGNRYTILRGEIRFFNPARIEPVVTMDLETRVRGYTVGINFSGPMNRLSFSYRSDPPLQPREIIALLTVGRPPAYSETIRPTDSGTLSFLEAGVDTLLGQALATPISSRLQRLFGVSRIKIDPQLSGVDNMPETYLTVEQQISRDITLTYVTNLSRTQQQIVRVEWNLSPEWSIYAVRDSNGVFGVDFVYRRSVR